MPRIISDDCVKCGACVDVCPLSAIKEGDAKYEIVKDICSDCGACEGVCPMGAISKE